MIPDGYLPPLRNIEDIPIERDSVRAVGLTHPQVPFKPYVYRGIGADLYEMPRARPWREPEPPPAQKPAPKPKPQPRRKPKPRAQPRPIEDVDLLVALDAAREAASVLAELDSEPAQTAPKPEIPSLPIKHRRRWGEARPAAGWKPLVGADLEDAWALLDED